MQPDDVAALVEALHRAGFAVGVDDALRIHRVLATPGLADDEHPDVIAALLGTHRADAEALARAVRAWRRPPGPAPPPARPKWLRRLDLTATFLRRYLLPLLAVGLLIALALGAATAFVVPLVLDALDADGDGALRWADCDDHDPGALPGDIESCDGVDNDCDGVVDEGDVGTWFPDADQDGFGAAVPAWRGPCAPVPDGYTDRSDDCDDGDPAVHPGAPDPEVDGVDQDCDGFDGPVGSSQPPAPFDLSMWGVPRWQAPAGALGLGAGLSFLALALIAGGRVRRRRSWRAAREALGDAQGARHYHLDLGPAAPPLPPAAAHALADAIRRRMASRGHRIDVRRTVLRMVREGLAADLVYKPRRARGEVLALVEHGIDMEVWRPRVDAFLDQLERQGIAVERMAYREDPSRPGRPGVLPDAKGRVLLVLGTGRGLDRDGARRLAAWPRRVWLCPIPDPRWWPAALAQTAGVLPVQPLIGAGVRRAAALLADRTGARAPAEPRPVTHLDVHRVNWIRGMVPWLGVDQAVAVLAHLLPVPAALPLVARRVAPGWSTRVAAGATARRVLRAAGDPLLDRGDEVRGVLLDRLDRCEPDPDSLAHLRWRKDRALVNFASPDPATRAAAVSELQTLATSRLQAEVVPELTVRDAAPDVRRAVRSAFDGFERARGGSVVAWPGWLWVAAWAIAVAAAGGLAWRVGVFDPEPAVELHVYDVERSWNPPSLRVSSSLGDAILAASPPKVWIDRDGWWEPLVHLDDLYPGQRGPWDVDLAGEPDKACFKVTLSPDPEQPRLLWTSKATCPVQGAVPFGELAVVATGPDGNTVDAPGLAAAVASPDRVSARIHPVSASPLRLPVGTYDVSLTAPDRAPAIEPVDVAALPQVATVTVVLGPETPTAPVTVVAVRGEQIPEDAAPVVELRPARAQEVSLVLALDGQTVHLPPGTWSYDVHGPGVTAPSGTLEVTGGPRELVVGASQETDGVEPVALTMATVREVVRSHQDALDACYAEALSRTPGLRGTAMIRFTVLPSGVVTGAQAIAVAGDDDALGTCLAAVFRRMQFPASRGLASLSYPLELTPPDLPAAVTGLRLTERSVLGPEDLRVDGRPWGPDRIRVLPPGEYLLTVAEPAITEGLEVIRPERGLFYGYTVPVRATEGRVTEVTVDPDPWYAVLVVTTPRPQGVPIPGRWTFEAVFTQSGRAPGRLVTLAVVEPGGYAFDGADRDDESDYAFPTAGEVLRLDFDRVVAEVRSLGRVRRADWVRFGDLADLLRRDDKLAQDFADWVPAILEAPVDAPAVSVPAALAQSFCDANGGALPRGPRAFDPGGGPARSWQVLLRPQGTVVYAVDPGGRGASDTEPADDIGFFCGGQRAE